jgi:hypothetical protein
MISFGIRPRILTSARTPPLALDGILSRSSSARRHPSRSKRLARLHGKAPQLTTHSPLPSVLGDLYSPSLAPTYSRSSPTASPIPRPGSW